MKPDTDDPAPDDPITAPGYSARRSAVAKDQQVRRKPLFLEQLAHQPECRLRIAPTLNEHVEDLALVVNGTPQVRPFPGDPNDHLIEVHRALGRGRA